MLGDLLRSIRKPADLAPVFGALGYWADVQRIDDSSWEVARWKGFQVIACEADDPKTGARLLASRLANEARRAIAVAIGSGEMAVAAPRLGTNGSSPIRRISLSAPDAAAIDFLQQLRAGNAPNALAHAVRIAEALSTEEVGERFFVAFRQILERMTGAIRAPESAPRSDVRTAALLPLTRILFLYFVQAKGWLDGRPDYLRRLLDATLARRKHFHRYALGPLFFGTLNRRPAARSGVARFGAIPYLNGGLFEPHPVERRLGPVLFSNELWRDAFDLLFERFRFCVREADEAGSIAPDMLGLVFERVMDSTDRRDTGTFYTPEAVVRQMVDAALATVLRSRLDPPTAEALLDTTKRPIPQPSQALDVLRALTVVDPAVGSGAFLLGALERLTELRLAVEPGFVENPSQLRRRVLAENLFGVDLNPIAVRLAELRLWLSVIADDPAADIPAITPLPNLDGVVRQGNSLLDPIGAVRVAAAGRHSPPAALGRAVARARTALFDARDSSVGNRMRELRDRELDLASSLLRDAEQSLLSPIRDLAGAARTPDLFGRSSGLSAAQRRRLRLLLDQRKDLRQAARAVRNGQVPFFSFDVHAPDAVTAGGFSVVVGNPPWVRAERILPALRSVLGERFTWWRGEKTRGYSHQPDLAVAFLQRAVELAQPGGAVALLLPAKVASSSYAEAARRHLVAETRIQYLHRVSAEATRSMRATIYPLAIVLQKSPPVSSSRVSLGFEGEDSIAQSNLSAPGPWILLPDRRRDALEQLRASGRPLASIAQPRLGTKTGADDLFVGDLVSQEGPVGRIRLAGREVMIERELLRPVIRGRDIHPFRLTPKKVIIWAHDAAGKPLAELPPLAAAWFYECRSRLRARADYREGPLWTVFRIPKASPNTVVWRDITRRPVAVAVDAAAAHWVALNTCYLLAAPDRETALIIAAVFNSVWCAALARYSADEAQAGHRRINARVASGFPIPLSGASATQLASFSAHAHAHPDFSRGDLDDAVAAALDLPVGVRHTLRSLAADLR